MRGVGGRTTFGTMGARAIRALLLASVAAAVPASLLWRGRSGVAASCAVALVGAVGLPRLFRRAGLQISGLLEILWLLPFAACWGLGEGWALFERIGWWDHLAHASGGLMAFALFRAWARPRLSAGPAALAAVSVLVALAIGAAWEIGEFASDTWLGTATQAGNTDTMLDLVWDGAGACIGALAVLGSTARWPAFMTRLPLLPLRRRGA